MVPAHGREIDGMDGWTVRADPSETGVVLTATAVDLGQAAKIRALGFIAQGSHQAHHLAMACRGDSPPAARGATSTITYGFVRDNAERRAFVRKPA
ncbi:hypothetical protein IGS68_21355 [Skermanella sp. TT6]|uniref:Uncharacterized protein n=1 Tax=Skermanella cutis TaxID=2775420 RepID=A0ABX7B407_9PROT|nr:hypothetical protein [Skermanella sp. TT6]QQP88550.1 hypothetical protein IGS68_21355 [Skermanella sp. TT6]